MDCLFNRFHLPVIRTGATATCYQCYIPLRSALCHFSRRSFLLPTLPVPVYVPVLFLIYDTNGCEFRVNTRSAIQTAQLVKLRSAVFELKQGTGGLTDTIVHTQSREVKTATLQHRTAGFCLTL